MNNGPTKGTGPEICAALKACDSIEGMYQVHKNQRKDGNINNTADEFIANTEKGKSGNIIKLSVSPDGKSYDVLIPSSGHKQTYQSK